METMYKELEEKFPEFFKDGITAEQFIITNIIPTGNNKADLTGHLKDGLPDNIKEEFLKIFRHP